VLPHHLLIDEATAVGPALWWPAGRGEGAGGSKGTKCQILLCVVATAAAQIGTVVYDAAAQYVAKQSYSTAFQCAVPQCAADCC
jgi:hypothetical protein